MSFSNGKAQLGPPGFECDLLYIACIISLVLSGPSPWSTPNAFVKIGDLLQNFSGHGMGIATPRNFCPIDPAQSTDKHRQLRILDTMSQHFQTILDSGK